MPVTAALAHDRRAHDVLTADCEEIADGVTSGAKRGDLPSLELLAQIYDRGECGIEQNQRLAGATNKKILTLRPSDPLANAYLAYFGDGRPKSEDRAIAYARIALREQDPFAAGELYFALIDSQSIASRREALKWDRVAARQGDVRASAIEADALIYGDADTPVNKSQGIQMLERADLSNCGLAARKLGIVYRDGAGVAVDKVEAESYFKRAVLLGNTYAGLLLALLYADTQNAAGAQADSLRFAHDAESRMYDNPDVKAAVGYIYMSQIGVPADFPRAAQLLGEGVDGGSTAAMDNLAYLKLNGLGVAKDFSGAIHLLLRSASHGDAFAKSELNDMQVQADYQNARISEANMEAAREFYQMSMQRQAQQNQMPYPGSPAYETINPPEPEEGGGE